MPISYNASRPNYRPARFEPKWDGPLLPAVEAFLLAHPELGETKFGGLSCGNWKIVAQLRQGAKPYAKTETAIRVFMRRYVAPQRLASEIVR